MHVQAEANVHHVVEWLLRLLRQLRNLPILADAVDGGKV